MLEATGGRGAGDQDQLCAVKGGQRARQRMKDVLADEDRSTSPARVERSDGVAGIDETLFLEDAVRGQKHLSVHVQDRRVANWSAET